MQPQDLNVVILNYCPPKPPRVPVGPILTPGGCNVVGVYASVIAGVPLTADQWKWILSFELQSYLDTARSAVMCAAGVLDLRNDDGSYHLSDPIEREGFEALLIDDRNDLRLVEWCRELRAHMYYVAALCKRRVRNRGQKAPAPPELQPVPPEAAPQVNTSTT